METQQTSPTPIDVWYQDQDRAVAEMLKTLERNRRRRKWLDQDEVQRRTDERVKRREEDFAEMLAIARAIYLLKSKQDQFYGLHLITGKRSEYWNKAYQRRHPGRDIDSHPAETLTDAVFDEINDEVRKEVVKEMLAEKEARKAAREAARRKRQGEA